MKRPKFDTKTARELILIISDAFNELARHSLRKKILKPTEALVLQAQRSGEMMMGQVDLRVGTVRVKQPVADAIRLMREVMARSDSKRKPRATRIPKTVEGLLRKWEPKKPR